MFPVRTESHSPPAWHHMWPALWRRTHSLMCLCPWSPPLLSVVPIRNSCPKSCSPRDGGYGLASLLPSLCVPSGRQEESIDTRLILLPGLLPSLRYIVRNDSRTQRQQGAGYASRPAMSAAVTKCMALDVAGQRKRERCFIFAALLSQDACSQGHPNLGILAFRAALGIVLPTAGC